LAYAHHVRSFSVIMMVGALVLPATIPGMTGASAAQPCSLFLSVV
jgi:hypothetical protein